MTSTNSSLWGCCADLFGDLLKEKIVERIKALASLENSINKLEREMKKLRAERDGKKEEADSSCFKDYRLRHTVAFTNWSEDVDNLHEEVKELLAKHSGIDGQIRGDATFFHSPEEGTGILQHQPGDPIGCSCGCCCGLCGRLKRRCCLLLKLSGQVARLIGAVSELREDGKEYAGEKLVRESEMYRATDDIVEMVGDDARSALSHIYKHLNDKDVGIIGIYGTAGVGKTQLLHHVEHAYLGKYQKVISTEVTPTSDIARLSENNTSFKTVVDVKRLRNSIGEKLSDPSTSSGWEDKTTLKNALGSLTFLLLLDNVWKKLDLEEIGIPKPNPVNGCKIVFATRSSAVCRDMDAKEVKLGPLKYDEGYSLFRKELGRGCEHEDLAKSIVEECHGIPQAIRVMASVMRKKNFKDDWEETEKALRDPRTMFGRRFLGEEKVLRPLMYSYRRLKSKYQPCLRYCSLFGDNKDVGIKEVTEYWIAEGFLDGGGDGALPSVKELRQVGNRILNRLVNACLLERSSAADEGDKVKMQGLVRDMAIKIAADEEDLQLVYPDSMNQEEKKGLYWERAKRISLTDNNIFKLPLPTKDCSNLLTLLLKNCRSLREIPARFFDTMSSLRVLDLSNTKVEVLPEDGIAKLVNVRYLNLSRTEIKSLPARMQEMRKIIHLNLSFTRNLEEIPSKAISDRGDLRILNLFESKYSNWVQDGSSLERGASLIDLDGLANLEELWLHIDGLLSFEDLLQSDVRRSTVGLSLYGFRGFPDMTRLEALDNLEELRIVNVLGVQELSFPGHWLLGLKVLELSCIEVSTITVDGVETPPAESGGRHRRLSKVKISKCHSLIDLSWIRHMGCVTMLSVMQCTRLREIITTEEFCFKSSLRTIHLEGLRGLTGFCRCKVEMSQQPSFIVKNCPTLNREFIYYTREDGREHRLRMLD